MAAKFTALQAYSKRNGFVLLRVDSENGDIELGCADGGRFAAAISEPQRDPVIERAVGPTCAR